MYVDGLILLSTFYNYFLLYMTGWMSAFRPGSKRMLIAAMFGAISMLLIYLPWGRVIMTLPGKIIIAALMILIVFKPAGAKEGVKLIVQFLLLSFLTGGFLFGLNIFPLLEFSSSSVYTVLSPSIASLLVVPLAVLLLLRLTKNYISSRNLNQAACYKLIIWFGNKKVCVSAFLDTGNRLREPISGLPVMLVSYQSLKSLLPSSWQEIWDSKEDDPVEKGQKIIGDSCLAPCFRLLTAQDYSGNQSFLWGFKPQRVEVIQNNKTIKIINQLYIGICSGPAAPFEDCHALLHPDIATTHGFVYAKEAL